jgi:hypothetical protein
VPIEVAEESPGEPIHSSQGRRLDRRPPTEPIDAALALIIQAAKVIVDNSQAEDERLTRAIQKEIDMVKKGTARPKRTSTPSPHSKRGHSRQPKPVTRGNSEKHRDHRV